jgi:putative oxidoreductase
MKLQKWTDNAIAITRIIVGAFMIYHGSEVFNLALMKGYETRLTEMKMSNAAFQAYVGKVAELLAGILLTLGLFTRIGAVIMGGTMAFITFIIGSGKFYYEDQHPFMFVLFAFIFFVDGGKKWSVDNLIFRGRVQ